MRIRQDHKNDALYLRQDEAAIVDSEESVLVLPWATMKTTMSSVSRDWV
ncbi:MAG: hypothetical protein KatS3mg023_2335 [Armatimonadota bacterium]|nr:MAG: hypothetical protein KatS3mg023_2335 [Armatimonadota bacterium]